MILADKEPYGLEPKFEAGVARLCCTSRQFWARIGKDVDPDRIQQPAAALLVGAARMVAKGLGHGPGSAGIVAQRLHRVMAEGRIKRDAVDAAVAMLSDLDAVDPAPDDAAAELVPIVRRKLQAEAVLAAHDEFAKRGDFATVVSQIERASRLGAEAEVDALDFDVAGFAELDDRAERLGTGVMELDAAIKGGTRRKELGFVLAPMGGGKSLFLINVAANALRRGMHVGVVTLEMSPAQQFARLAANLTGIPTDDILDKPDQRARAEGKLRGMLAQLGACSIAYMTPDATTVADLIPWVAAREAKVGRKMSLLVVDYADKMVPKPGQKHDNTYVAMKHVYGGLRTEVAVARDMWVWTGSQAKSRDKRHKGPITTQDAADSMHKGREADFVVSINKEDDMDGDDSGMVSFHVSKNRGGRDGFSVGPCMTDRERGRIVVL